MDKQKIIKSRWTTINRLFIALVIFTLLILIVREYQTFRSSINYFNKTTYEYFVHEVQHEVDNRIEEINSVRAEIGDDFRQTLSSVVQDVDFFATKTLENAPPGLTLEEKRALYIDVVYQYDIQEDEYLFFAMDLNGISYLSGLTKNLEGTDISNLQDQVTGRYFVLDMIEIINTSVTNDGYIDYYWIKEVGGEHLKKTSYIYYNEEVQLFIGTGVYEIDYIQSVQTELFDRISSYYSSLDDYVYIMDYDGNVIYHPLQDFDSEDLLSIETLDGNFFHEYTVEKLSNSTSVIFDYYFDFTGEEQIKTAYIRRIDGWDMYIGKSFVVDDLVLEQQQYLQSVIVEYIVYNSLALLSIVVLVFILKKMITNNFSDTEEVFKIQNDKILESSYRDQLTKIYNRRYFDKAIEHLPIKNGQVTAIMIDANGLKLINDAYGHEVGDKLLVTISQIMERVFLDALHFRWGGDEFVIIINHAKEKEIKKMIQAFHKECKENKLKQITLSASVGYALNDSENLDIYDLINRAEVMMYNNKVYESSSTKRQIIDNILDNLYNNFDFEKQHSENVKSYAVLIGQEMNLDKQELAKLRLAALLHDVGKIAVPTDVLLKSGKLTDKEYEEVRKHSEKGYRILGSYPELSEFGIYALSHHERVDGTGYPKGLKGDEIPLFSRIICVADAFDAMTSRRVYKQEMSVEDAIKELQRNKGKQFDPEIVDTFIKIIQ